MLYGIDNGRTCPSANVKSTTRSVNTSSGFRDRSQWSGRPRWLRRVTQSKRPGTGRLKVSRGNRINPRIKDEDGTPRPKETVEALFFRREILIILCDPSRYTFPPLLYYITGDKQQKSYHSWSSRRPWCPSIASRQSFPAACGAGARQHSPPKSLQQPCQEVHRCPVMVVAVVERASGTGKEQPHAGQESEEA